MIRVGLLVASLVLATGAAEPLKSPLEAGWQGHRVCELLDENAHMRSLRCTFPPGVGHERHFHAPHWGYVLQGGVMQVTTADGSAPREFKSGSHWWSDGIDWHEGVNIGQTTAVYVIVEPKAR